MQVYDINELGFLTNCSEQLDDYYQEWYILDKELDRDHINKMPILSINKLKTLKQCKKAYSMLSILANKYIWSYDETPITLPKSIAKPLWELSVYLGIPPLLTHASVDLYNWELIDKDKEFSLDNIRSINTITKTKDEEWFYLIMVSIEGECGEILKDIYNLKEIMKSNSLTKDFLIKFNLALDKCIKNISRMKENCNPDVFYNVLRKYLSGWHNNEKLPYGLLYDGVSDVPLKYKGGSAAQSSLIQVFDAVLGIKHESDFLMEMRYYMPKQHKKFIELIESYPLFYNTLNESNKVLFNKCVKKLNKFRGVHMGLVRDYIIKPMNKGKKQFHKGKGTGGTELNKFLKKIKDNTVILNDENVKTHIYLNIIKLVIVTVTVLIVWSAIKKN